MKHCSVGFAIIFFVLGASVTDTHAGFTLSLSPMRWEARADAGETIRTLVRLSSGQRTVQKVRPVVGDWALTENGTPEFFPGGTRSNSAANWLQFVPDEFSVYPRQRKSFKLSMTIPEDTPDGSYMAALFFEQPGDELPEKLEGTTIFLRGRLAFMIYVTVGAASPRGEVLEASWRKITERPEPMAALNIANRGDAHLRTLGIFSARSLQDGKKYEGSVVSVPVLPGQSRWVPLEFSGAKPAPGTILQLNLRIELGQGEQQVDIALNGILENG